LISKDYIYRERRPRHSARKYEVRFSTSGRNSSGGAGEAAMQGTQTRKTSALRRCDLPLGFGKHKIGSARLGAARDAEGEGRTGGWGA